MEVLGIIQSEIDKPLNELIIKIKYEKRENAICEMGISYETHENIDAGIKEVEVINLNTISFKEGWGRNMRNAMIDYFTLNQEDLKIKIQEFINE